MMFPDRLLQNSLLPVRQLELRFGARRVCGLNIEAMQKLIEIMRNGKVAEAYSHAHGAESQGFAPPRIPYRSLSVFRCV